MASKVQLDEMAKMVDVVTQGHEVIPVETVPMEIQGREVLPVPLVIADAPVEPESVVPEVKKVNVDSEDQKVREVQLAHPEHLHRRKRDQKARLVIQVQTEETASTVVTETMGKKVPKVNEVQTVNLAKTELTVAMELMLFALMAKKAQTEHQEHQARMENPALPVGTENLETPAERDRPVSTVCKDQLANAESLANPVIKGIVVQTAMTVNKVPTAGPESQVPQVQPVEMAKKDHKEIEVMLVATVSPVQRVQKDHPEETVPMAKKAHVVHLAAEANVVTQVRMEETANLVLTAPVVSPVFKDVTASAATLVPQVYPESSTSSNSVLWLFEPCAKSMPSALVTTTTAHQTEIAVTSLTNSFRLIYKTISPYAEPRIM